MSDSTDIKKWLEYAANDLLVAKDLQLQEAYTRRAILTHCQQSAEKYLKAFILKNGLAFEKIHDLLRLNKRCEVYDEDFKMLKDDLSWLSSMYLESRYPDDFEDIDIEDAEKALKIADKAEQFILKKIE